MKMEKNDINENTYFYNFKIAGPVPDSHGDSIYNATEIQLGSLVTGSIDYKDDIDCFSYTPSKDGEFFLYGFFRTDKRRYSIDSYSLENLYIFDSDGNLIMLEYTNDRAQFQLKKDVTYYVFLTSDENCPIYNYSFKLRDISNDDIGNSFGSAKAVSPDECFNGELNYYNDTDIFRYIPSKDGDYTINFNCDLDESTSKTHDVYELKCNFTIYDKNGRTILNTVCCKGSRNVFSFKTNNEYYIAVTSVPSLPLSKYSFNIEGPIIPVIDDYGDTKETATKIQLNQEVKGKWESFDDVDYFTFRPNSDGIYSIKIKDSSLRNNVDLYDINGNKKLLSSNDYHIFNVDVQKDQEYYLWTKGNDDQSQEYSLTIIGPVFDDFVNTKETAKQLNINEPVKADINYYGDSDYFSFTPSEDGIYYLDQYVTTYKNAPGFESPIKLFDSSNNRRGISYINSIPYLKLEKNIKYILEIRSEENFTEYPCNFSFRLKGPIKEVRSNSMETAIPIELFQKNKGFSDSDNPINYFSFKTSEAGVYKWEIDFSFGGDSRYMYLLGIYDSSGKRLEHKYNDTCTFLNLNKDTTYYFSISHYQDYSMYGYSFTVSGPIPDDYTNLKEEANEIKVGNTNKGEINYLKDCDYFRFIPQKSGIYYLSDIIIQSDIPQENIGTDSIIEVFDSWGGKVDFLKANEPKFQFELTKGNPYYIVPSSGSIDLLYKYSFVLKEFLDDDFGNRKSYSTTLYPEKVINGKINYYGDRDCFSFKTNIDGVYTISVSQKICIDVSDSNNNILETCSSYFEEENISYYLSKGKTYYVDIYEKNGQVNYSLVLKTPVADDYDNYTFRSVTPKYKSTILRLNNPTTGSISYRGDNDVFQVIPQILGKLYINLDSPNLSIQPVDNYEGNFDYSYITDRIIEINVLKLEPIRIMVDCHDESYTGDYTITVSDILESKFYSVSINESDESNFKIVQEPTNKAMIVDQHIAISDKDRFSISAPEDGWYLIEVDSKNTNTQDLLYHLIITDNNVIINNNIYNDSDNRRFFHKTDHNIYLYLQGNHSYNFSPEDDGNIYEFNFTIKGPVPDGYGNNIQTAYTIDLLDKVMGVFSDYKDVDYFSYKPTESGIYSINFFYSIRGVSKSVLNVFDEDGKPVNVEYNGQKAYFSFMKDKKYYMAISNFDRDPFNEYTFLIDGPILDDYKNTADEAIEIFLDENISGEANYYVDFDYFKFTASTTGKYLLDDYHTEFSENPKSSYLNLKIFDSNGNLVCGNRADPYTETKIYFDVIKGHTYFICMTNDLTESTFKYSFKLSNSVIDDYGSTPSYSGKIELGIPISAKINYPYDADCFYFSSGSKGIYNISTKGDVGFWLVDDTNKEVDIYREYGPVSYVPNDYRIYYLDEKRTYYIKVKKSDSKSIDYSMLVDGPCVDDYTNSNLNAEILKIDTTVEGKIDYTKDKDIFIFEPQDAGDFYVKLDDSVHFSVKPLDGQYTYIGDNILKLKVDGQYERIYLEVECNDETSTGAYKLTVSENLYSLIGESHKVSGYIKPSFVNDSKSPLKSGFVVALKDLNVSTTTNENGYFEFSDLSESISRCDLIISKDGFIKREIKDITVGVDTKLSTTDLPIEIWAGDIGKPEDGVVNMTDILQLAKSFGCTKDDPNYLEACDLNGDFAVNMIDVLIIAKSFGLTVDDYSKIKVQ